MLTGWLLLLAFGGLLLLLVAIIVMPIVGWIGWNARYLPVRGRPTYGICKRTTQYPCAEIQVASAVSRFFAPTGHFVATGAPYVLHQFWWKVDEQLTTDRLITVNLDYVEDIDRYVGNAAYEFSDSVGGGRVSGPAVHFQTRPVFMQQFRINMQINFSSVPATQIEAAAQHVLESQMTESSPKTLICYEWRIENKINHRSPLAQQIIDYTIEQLGSAVTGEPGSPL